MVTSEKGKIRVGVLRGGPSPEYDISLRSGAEILKHLPEAYSPVDIFISRDGDWHVNGFTKSPEKIFPHVDVVWNALHGSYGEDGKVQQLFQTYGVPFTGSRAFSSALGMNKNVSKALFQYHGLKTPEFTVIHPHDNSFQSLIELFHSFPQPSIIKPLSGGSSIAVTVARDFNTFRNGIEKVFKHGGSVIIEEYIPGMEVSCVVVEGSDGDTLYSLFPVGPQQKQNGIFNPQNIASGEQPVCPAPLSVYEKETIQQLALSVHKHFNLRHYSIIDAIIHPTRGAFLLEVNTLPGTTHDSLLSASLGAAGISMGDFVDHILTLAIEHK